MIRRDEDFIGKKSLTFIVVSWYQHILDNEAKKQNFLVEFNEQVLRIKHEEIAAEIDKKEKGKRDDENRFIFTEEKYHIPPSYDECKTFEGQEIYSPYDHIHVDYSTMKYLDSNLKTGKDNIGLAKLTDTRQLKMADLVMVATGFLYDDAVESKQLCAYFPLHTNSYEVEKKFNTDNSLLVFPWNYNVDALRDYFGEKLGFYFVFNQHFTKHLATLAVLGLLMEAYMFYTGDTDGIPSSIFAVMVVFWGSLMMADWSYQLEIQSFRWGMDNFAEVACVRPQFKLLVDSSEDSEVAPETEMTDLSKDGKKVEEDDEIGDAEGGENDVLFSFFGLFEVPKLFCCRTSEVDKNGKAFGCVDLIVSFFKVVQKLLLGGSEKVKSPMDRNPHRSEYVYRSRLNHTARKYISTFVVVLCGALIVFSTFSVYYFQAYVKSAKAGSFLSDNSKYATSLVNKLQTAVYAPIFNFILLAMNEFENHRTDTGYQDGLITKKATIGFINTFFSYYYIAFIAQYVVYDFGNGQDYQASESCGGYDTCMESLRYNFYAAVLGTLTSLVNLRVYTPFLHALDDLYVNNLPDLADVVGQFFEAPMRPQKEIPPMKEGEAKDEHNFMREVIKQYAHRASSGSYEATHLFDDYTKLFEQFGYMILFLPALPALAVITFFTAWAELKLDAEKLIDEFLRPYPMGAPGIGSWRYCFDAMALLAVPTNAALVVFTMNAFDLTSLSSKLVTFIGMQWAILIAIYISRAIFMGGSTAITIQKARAANVKENLENLVADNKLLNSNNKLNVERSKNESLQAEKKSLTSSLEAANNKVSSKDKEIANLKAQLERKNAV